jgi:Na+/phosphate symporter
VAAAVGVYWFLGSAVLSLVALAQVIRSAFSLCDRADARARPRLHRARIWIIAHHVLAFGVGTALFVLLMLTTQFFRDGGDHPTRLMGQLVGAYLVGVIVPALAALPFVRALHSIAPLYVASPEESGEHLT